MKKKIKTKKRAKSANRSPDPDSVEAVGEPKNDRLTVDYDKFVRVWSSASSVSEVAEAMGIKRNSASAIAARLRGAGVTLRKFPRRGAQPIDVKRLNKIASGKAS